MRKIALDSMDSSCKDENAGKTALSSRDLASFEHQAETFAEFTQKVII